MDADSVAGVRATQFCAPWAECDAVAVCAALGIELDEPEATPLGVSISDIPDSALPFELTREFLGDVRMMPVNSPELWIVCRGALSRCGPIWT